MYDGSAQAPGDFEPQPPADHIYKITAKQLQDIFVQQADGVFDQVLLDRRGKAEGIIKKLASNRQTGIVGDKDDLFRRKRVFGENKRPTPPSASIMESICQTLQNVVWLAISVTALLSSVVSLFFLEWKTVWEGISIIIVEIFLVALISATDYLKDEKFIQLSQEVKEDSVPVIRGNVGASRTISVWDVVAGDIIILETGSAVPADCLIVEDSDLQVDEPAQEDAEGNLLEPNRDVNKNKDDPWLIAGSIIKRGQCKALVCCVGANSTRGLKERKMDTDQDTALQTKLHNLEGHFIKFALFACLFVLVLLVLMLILKLTDEVWYKVLLQHSLRYANILVVLFVVCVPEGLPLTIGVSLAFTTERMFREDRILVKKLDAPEKMGEVDEILCGKTSTLTTGKMKVSQFFCEEKSIKNTRKNTLLFCELSQEALELLKESMLYNCSARIEMDETHYIPVGNATEVGLLNFLQDADFAVHNLIKQKIGRIKKISPFSSLKKRSASVIQHPHKPGIVTVYLKGAPELILNMCQTILSTKGVVELNEDLKQEITEEVYDNMAAAPLRVISFAYAEMATDQWNAQYEQTGKEFEQALDDGQIQFTFLAAFGLKDPLRDNVKSIVNAIKQKNNVNVRMISGDHYRTAKRVAEKAGILGPEDLEKENAIMDADTFRTMVGEIQKVEIEGEEKLTLTSQENFLTVLEDVKVLYRANSEDKLMMVIGLKNSDKTVAVTGDGINDVEALEQADVGLAMGSGCSAAKQASSLILAGDDFEASIRAVMWGRNIYHNVGRFMQFQVTVNISVLLTVVIGTIFFGECPLSAVQLLWINLIMDTFAAIALSTEPPLEKILKTPPTSKTNILTPAIWRQILGVSLWNFIIVLLMFLFGGLLAGLESFRYYGDKISTISPQSECSDLTQIAAIKKSDTALATICAPYWGGQMKLRLFTYVLCTFVFMQVFNYINCRKIGHNEINVFERIFSKINVWFWIVIAFICVFQVLMVQWFFILTRTTPLTRSEWGACIVVGMSVLPVSFGLKFFPGLLKRMPFTKFVDENQKGENALVQSVNKYSNVQINLSEKMQQRQKKKDAAIDENDDDYKPMPEEGA